MYNYKIKVVTKIIGVLLSSALLTLDIAWAQEESTFSHNQLDHLSPQIQIASDNFFKVFKSLAIKKMLPEKVKELAEILYKQMEYRDRCQAVNWNHITDYRLLIKKQISYDVTYLLYEGETEEGLGQEYFEFFMSNNKLIGYGSSFLFSGTAQLTFHIFEEERGQSKPFSKERSKMILVDRLRELQDIAHMSILRFDLPRDQFNNPDALKFGAIAYYMKLGFIPKNKEIYPLYVNMMKKMNLNLTLTSNEIQQLVVSDWELRTKEINIFSSDQIVQIPEVIFNKFTDLEKKEAYINQSV